MKMFGKEEQHLGVPKSWAIVLAVPNKCKFRWTLVVWVLGHKVKIVLHSSKAKRGSQHHAQS
jgi:hypothetical protein